MSSYVTELQIRSVEKKIMEERNDIINHVKEFNSLSWEISSLLKKLRIFYDTPAGELKTNRIAKIKFSNKKLSYLIKEVDEIKIDYYLSNK